MVFTARAIECRRCGQAYPDGVPLTKPAWAGLCDHCGADLATGVLGSRGILMVSLAIVAPTLALCALASVVAGVLVLGSGFFLLDVATYERWRGALSILSYGIGLAAIAERTRRKHGIFRRRRTRDPSATGPDAPAETAGVVLARKARRRILLTGLFASVACAVAPHLALSSAGLGDLANVVAPLVVVAGLAAAYFVAEARRPRA